jgi:hypothetical protein
MTVPFAHSSKNGHQLLTDILLQIPACTALSGLSGNLGDVFVESIPDTVDLRPVQRRTAQLIHDLDEWRETYPHLCTPTSGPTFVTMDMSKLLTEDPAKSAIPALMLPDTFVALTTSTYKATRLILTLFQNKITPIMMATPSSLTHSDKSPVPDAIATSTQYAREIIDLTLFLESRRPVGMDFMRSIFPLVVVASLGPGKTEQDIAKEMLIRWGTSRGVGGLCGAWKSP